MKNKNIGYLAGSCTSLAFIPQVYKVYKTKEAKGLSLTTLIIFFIGQLAWIIHGYLTNDIPILIFAKITAVLYIYLIYAKLKYK
jgi:MtN3 and saliva related transmembrane protein